VDETQFNALTGYVTACLPEAVLTIAACALFLGGTLRRDRHLWGAFALLSLAAAGVFVWLAPNNGYGTSVGDANIAPVVYDRMSLFFRVLALVGGAVLVLFAWDEVPDDQAADYHACLLLITAGTALAAASNELVTLFLALELVSIPTYVLLYLPRTDSAAQESAMKYFLLSVFSSAFLLFGFSYLYGLTGTTNLPAISDALVKARNETGLPGVALVALVMVVAGLGFRITAVPFHFYAPDVYQGTSTANAALLAFVPKVGGFAALLRVLGYVPPPAELAQGAANLGLTLGEQVPVLFWIMAAVTMSLGNVLALLQDNVKRLLAYSSVAHAGYMLIGLAVAPKLGGVTEPVGVEAVLFYLVAYGAMTVGAFAVLSYLSTPEYPVERIDHLAGLGRSHPGLALLMALFMFSLIGIPLTAGFMGKFLLFYGAFLVPAAPAQQHYLYMVLLLIAVINAAIGGYYYLRVTAVMFLRDPVHAVEKPRTWPVLLAIWVCALLTLAAGVYPEPLKQATQAALPRAAAAAQSGQPASALAADARR
jgi:NADH-quinone oxidoreductase subunit N